MQLPPQLPGLDLNKEKVCLFSRKGELLWRSPAWAGREICEKTEREVLGTRYFEFVFPEDLPGVLAFFADGGKGSHRFRAYGPTLAMYLEIHYEKISHGENWLVFATAVETQDRPAMLKAMLLSLPFIAITAKISAAAAAAAAAADLAA